MPQCLLGARLLLRPRHCLARLNWRQLHQRWAVRQWGMVVFSDECRFRIDSNDGRKRVYRRRNDIQYL